MLKPNIIFILIDDMGWKDLACYHSSFYESPNIDRLASQGMLFTDAYAACPVCSPTRASILSGKYPARVGLTNYIAGAASGKLLSAPYTKNLPLKEKSIASTLREAGYSTWHVGKWHLGSAPYYPQHHGFDVNIAGCAWGHPHNGFFAPWQIENLCDGSPGEYLTDRLTDEAINLINNSAEKPFFLNLWYYAVHTPIQAKPEKIAEFKRKAKALGLDSMTTFSDDEFFPSFEKKQLQVRRRLLQSDPAYAAMIESLDDNIGRLLLALEKSGKADNTIVIFTSDNGGLATSEGSPTCNAPLAEGKGWMYEGGTRVPLFVKWPNMIEPGSVCSTPISSPDFYPTLLEVANLPLMPEQHCDGESLLPLLLQSNTLVRDSIFWHYPHYGNQGGTPGSSVRCGDFKLIEFFEDNRLELYNLNLDISEDYNVVDDYPEIVAKLHQKLVSWRQNVEAKIPQPNPDFYD